MADTKEHRDDVVTGLPLQQYDQEQSLPSVYTYPTYPSDVPPARSDDVVTGLPLQQYNQEQPLPSTHTYPTYPGGGVHYKGGGSTHVNVNQPQPVSQLIAMTTSPTGASQLHVSQVAIAEPLTNPPSHYLGLSIFSVFCCWLIGIFAIIQSGKYSSKASFTLSDSSLIRHNDESDRTIWSD